MYKLLNSFDLETADHILLYHRPFKIHYDSQNEKMVYLYNYMFVWYSPFQRSRLKYKLFIIWLYLSLKLYRKCYYRRYRKRRKILPSWNNDTIVSMHYLKTKLYLFYGSKYPNDVYVSEKNISSKLTFYANDSRIINKFTSSIYYIYIYVIL